jgi:hypothetical protein
MTAYQALGIRSAELSDGGCAGISKCMDPDLQESSVASAEKSVNMDCSSLLPLKLRLTFWEVQMAMLACSSEGYWSWPAIVGKTLCCGHDRYRTKSWVDQSEFFNSLEYTYSVLAPCLSSVTRISGQRLDSVGLGSPPYA